MHGRHAIPNDEFLYVLSTFVFEPIRWNERSGWRPLLRAEKLASFHFWRGIARRMAIRDVPEDYETFERYYDEFARLHFRYAPENRALAIATPDLLLGWYLPKPPWPIGRPFIHALLDDPLLAAVGLPRPHPLVRRLMESAIRLRSRIVRRLPPRRAPRLITGRRHPTYPDGYTIEEHGVHSPRPPGGCQSPVNTPRES